MMDNDGWIKIEPNGQMPNNYEWVEVVHSLLDETLEWFYWDKYGFDDDHLTHWRRLSWYFDPSPIESAYNDTSFPAEFER